MTAAGRAWGSAAVVFLVALEVCFPLPQGTSSDGAGIRVGAICATSADCDQIPNAECNQTLSKCQCPKNFPIDVTSSCLPVVGVGGNCTVTSQCRPGDPLSECAGNGVCTCPHTHIPYTYTDGSTRCHPRDAAAESSVPVDPVMVSILVSLVLMFVVICIVLQLFSKARFRQNRTVLNSANPRLMNTSLFKGNAGKRGIAGAQRPRGSHGSIETGGVGSITGEDTTQLEIHSPESGSRDERASPGVTRLPKITLPPLKSSGKQTPADDGRDSVVKQMKIEVAESGD